MVRQRMRGLSQKILDRLLTHLFLHGGYLAVVALCLLRRMCEQLVILRLQVMHLLGHRKP